MTFDNCKFDEKIIPEKLLQLPKSTLKNNEVYHLTICKYWNIVDPRLKFNEPIICCQSCNNHTV